MFLRKRWNENGGLEMENKGEGRGIWEKDRGSDLWHIGLVTASIIIIIVSTATNEKRWNLWNNGFSWIV